MQRMQSKRDWRPVFGLLEQKKKESANSEGILNTIIIFALSIENDRTMKPIKNRVYCIDCGRSKQLFETEKQADNFIKFNSEEIMETEEKAPVRSYFCPSCGGWHVTSSPVAFGGPTRSERMIEKMKVDREARREVHLEYDKKIKEAKERIKGIIDILPEEFEKLKAQCGTCADRDEKLELIMAFRKKLTDVRATMYLKQGQRKMMHHLEQDSKIFYYDVKNGQ